MDNKKKLLIIVVIFILLMIGAAILYKTLGENAPQQDLVTLETKETSNETINETTKETIKDTIAETSQETAENIDEESSQETAEPAPVAAPDFTVYDIDGNEVHLSDFIGKPIILNFWASWCGPCKSEMPDFQEKYLEYGEDIHFLFINMTDGSRETVETASSFIEEQGYTFPIYYDKDMDAANTYGAYSLPTTFFIDAEGYAIAYYTGAMSGEILQTGIDMIQ